MKYILNIIIFVFLILIKLNFVIADTASDNGITVNTRPTSSEAIGLNFTVNGSQNLRLLNVDRWTTNGAEPLYITLIDSNFVAIANSTYANPSLVNPYWFNLSSSIYLYPGRQYFIFGHNRNNNYKYSEATTSGIYPVNTTYITFNGRVTWTYGSSTVIPSTIQYVINSITFDVIGSTAPTYNKNLSNITIAKNNDSILYQVNWSENSEGNEYCVPSYNNGSGIYINQTPVNMLNQSNFMCNFTTIITSVRSNSTYLKFFANNSLGNWNETTPIIINITNTPPVLSDIIINPLPRLSNVDINCSWTVIDADRDNVTNETKWYKNNIEQTILGNITFVGANNLTGGDNWSCSVQSYDGYNYSGFVNSSVLNIGDNSAPNLTVSTLSSSYLTTDVISVIANCSDTLSSISYVKFFDTFDNLNRTMSLSSSSIYIFNSTFALGTHNLSVFYCRDTSGNINETNTSIIFAVNNPSSSSGSSGGGGSGSSPVSSKNKCNINYTVSPIVFQYTDRVKAIYVTNLENKSVGLVYSLNDSTKFDVRSPSSAILFSQQTAEVNLIKTFINISTTLNNELIIESNECEKVAIPIISYSLGVKKSTESIIYDELNIEKNGIKLWYLIVLSFVISGSIAYFKDNMNSSGKVFLTIFFGIIFSIISRIGLGLVL